MPVNRPVPRKVSRLRLAEKETFYVDPIECALVVGELLITAWETYPDQVVTSDADNDLNTYTEDLQDTACDKLFSMLDKRPCYILSEGPLGEIKKAYIELSIIDNAIKTSRTPRDKKLRLMEMVRLNPLYTKTELSASYQRCIMSDLSAERSSRYWDRLAQRVNAAIAAQFTPRIEIMMRGTHVGSGFTM